MVGLLLDHMADSPRALVGRNGILPQPLAHRIVEEVLPWADRWIDELGQVMPGVG